MWPESSYTCGFERLLEEYFPLKPGFTMSRHYYGRSLKNGKNSGGFFIESGNSVFEPTVTTGQISFMLLQAYDTGYQVITCHFSGQSEKSSESFSVFLQM